MLSLMWLECGALVHFIMAKIVFETSVFEYRFSLVKSQVEPYTTLIHQPTGKRLSESEHFVIFSTLCFYLIFGVSR